MRIIRIAHGSPLGIEIFSKKEAVERFPDLQPFLYREKTDDFHPLANQLANFLKFLGGVEFVERGPYFACFVPDLRNISPNRFNQQSCQMMLHITQESCLFYGLCHRMPDDTPGVSWPIYFPESGLEFDPRLAYLWVMDDGGKLLFSSGSKISPKLYDVIVPWKKTDFNVSGLPCKEFYPVLELFSEEGSEVASGKLLALRCKTTSKFAPLSVLAEVAKKAGLKT